MPGVHQLRLLGKSAPKLEFHQLDRYLEWYLRDMPCLKNYEAFSPLVWQSEQLVHLSS